MAAFERLTLGGHFLVAHGGVAGTVIELSLVVGVVAVFVAVWLRERRASRSDD